MKLANERRMLSADETSGWSPEVAQRVEQARKRRRRGDMRKALLLLREACCVAEADARLWTMYAVHCWRLHKRDDARQALRHALWLRDRANDVPRARVTRALLLAMESACAPDVLRAA